MIGLVGSESTFFGVTTTFHGHGVRRSSLICRTRVGTAFKFHTTNCDDDNGRRQHRKRNDSPIPTTLSSTQCRLIISWDCITNINDSKQPIHKRHRIKHPRGKVSFGRRGSSWLHRISDVDNLGDAKTNSTRGENGRLFFLTLMITKMNLCKISAFEHGRVLEITPCFGLAWFAASSLQLTGMWLTNSVGKYLVVLPTKPSRCFVVLLPSSVPLRN